MPRGRVPKAGEPFEIVCRCAPRQRMQGLVHDGVQYVGFHDSAKVILAPPSPAGRKDDGCVPETMVPEQFSVFGVWGDVCSQGEPVRGCHGSVDYAADHGSRVEAEVAAVMRKLGHRATLVDLAAAIAQHEDKLGHEIDQCAETVLRFFVREHFVLYKAEPAAFSSTSRTATWIDFVMYRYGAGKYPAIVVVELKSTLLGIHERLSLHGAPALECKTPAFPATKRGYAAIQSLAGMLAFRNTYATNATEFLAMAVHVSGKLMFSDRFPLENPAVQDLLEAYVEAACLHYPPARSVAGRRALAVERHEIAMRRLNKRLQERKRRVPAAAPSGAAADDARPRKRRRKKPPLPWFKRPLTPVEKRNVALYSRVTDATRRVPFISAESELGKWWRSLPVARNT